MFKGTVPVTGWVFVESRQGVPIRIEIGPRDVKEDKFVMVRRDTASKVK